MNKPKIAIFTLCRDRLEYTKKTFEEMRKTAGIKFDHFVLNNGSTDDTDKWLKENEKLFKKVIYSPDNKGIWVGINILLRETNFFEGYEFVCKVDNDVEFFNDSRSKDWLLKLYKISMSALGEEWILSPYIGGLGRRTGGAPRTGIDLIQRQKISTSMHVGGICLFTPQKAYSEFMPETMAISMGWDVFFCSKLRGQSYRCGYIEDIIIKHRDGTVGQEEKNKDYYNRKVYESKIAYKGDNRNYNL